MGSLQRLQQVGEGGSVLIGCALLGSGLSRDTPHPGRAAVELGGAGQLPRCQIGKGGDAAAGGQVLLDGLAQAGALRVAVLDVVLEVGDHAVSSPSVRSRLSAVRRAGTFWSALR